jgi:hypothetical protein
MSYSYCGYTLRVSFLITTGLCLLLCQKIYNCYLNDLADDDSDDDSDDGWGFSDLDTESESDSDSDSELDIESDYVVHDTDDINHNSDVEENIKMDCI